MNGENGKRIELEVLNCDSVIAVRLGVSHLGCVRLSSNTYHAQNAYICFDDGVILHEIAAELFSRLFDLINKPLQVMVSSDDDRIVDFLTAGGFMLKRCCYSVSAGRGDYREDTAIFESAGAPQLLSAKRGKREYEMLARLLFDHYKRTHAQINPFTAGFEEFCALLHDEAFY